MFKKIKTKLVALAGFTCGALAFAADDNTSQIPDIGVNLSSYISEIGTKLGVVLGASVLLAIAIWIVRKGWNLYKSLQGR